MSVFSLPRILGIEDDPVQQMILDRVASQVRPQLRITWANNAEEARWELDFSDFDLVIADVALGRGPSGLELWENAKNGRWEMPFLFVTSLGYESFLAGIGPFEVSPPYLSKPIYPGEAIQVIASLLKLDPREDRPRLNTSRAP